MKISLTKLLSGFLSANQLNNNSDKIEDAFENTLSRDGTAPNDMQAVLDMGSNRIINLGAPVDPNDAVRLSDLAEGGSATVDWSTVQNKPTSFNPDVEAVQDIVGGQLQGGSNISIVYDDTLGKSTISATGSLAADYNTLINKPSTFPPSAHTHTESEITGLTTDLANLSTSIAGKANTVHTHTHTDITDWQEAVEDTVGAQIQAGANMTVTYNDTTGKITLDAASGGASSQKPVLLSSFGTIDSGGVNTSSNDTALTAAEASSADLDVYLPKGTYASTKDISTLTKHYMGRGTIKLGTAVYPPNTSYIATKPTTSAVQGLTGWFDGDQRFNDGGEYKIIGPNVRTYDTTARYYESNVMPHHAWFDIMSGNSGSQAWLTSGATAGATTVTIHATPSAEWVGKNVNIINGHSGPIQETKTIASVNTGAKTVTFTTGLAANYTWNPSAGLIPGINFAGRTWNGHTYVKVNHTGGGDGYGHIVRMVVGYQPKPSETHTFMAATGGQYGGDVTFTTSGTYATGWESQYVSGNNDVAAIAQVDSFIRNSDYALTGGKYWGGTHFKSEGTRPADVAHNVIGMWRNGIDMVLASLVETTRLTSTASTGVSSISVASVNGAHIGDTMIIGEGPSQTVTITSVGTTTINFTPALTSTYGVDTFVKLTKGGAAMNLGANQRIIWNSSTSTTGRGTDSLGIYSGFYGNKQGDIIMEAGTDGGGEFWSVRFARGASTSTPDTSRIRLRDGAVQIYGATNINGALGLTTDMNMVNNARLSLGTNCWITFNGTHLIATVNGGTSYTTIV